MMPDLSSPIFWTALLQIIIIDIILSGDNAVVIALAVRRLPKHLQRRAVFWGTGAAIAARLILAAFAIALLKLPYLKLVGAVLLLYIGIKLMLPEPEDDPSITESDNFIGAVKTIVVADVVMSVDNVIAVAGAAKDSLLLFGLGIAISIPLIIFASQILLKMMERYPVIITIGAALLGFVAGEMAHGDPVLKPFFAQYPNWVGYVMGVVCAIVVVAAGKALAARKPPPKPPAAVA
jgi:YjbE family integral membrane protein